MGHIYFVTSEKEGLRSASNVGSHLLLSFYFRKSWVGLLGQLEDLSRIFLDSGAYSLFMNHVKKGDGYAFYDSQEFWDYVDSYAAFVKRHRDIIRTYVSVDVIRDPERSWAVQRYLEDEHGLRPLPVYHYGEDIKWLKKYMDNYAYIGTGGLAGNDTKHTFISHGDRMFRLLCNSRGKPKVKVHGFAMTSPEMVARYPWYSVDSATHRLQAAYGFIFVPRFVDGKFDYRKHLNRYVVTPLAENYSELGGYKYHLRRDRKAAKIVHRYLNKIGYELGKTPIEECPSNRIVYEGERLYRSKTLNKCFMETIIEPGLSNDQALRAEVNMLTLKRMFRALSKDRSKGKWIPDFLI